MPLCARQVNNYRLAKFCIRPVTTVNVLYASGIRLCNCRRINNFPSCRFQICCKAWLATGLCLKNLNNKRISGRGTKHDVTRPTKSRWIKTATVFETCRSPTRGRKMSFYSLIGNIAVISSLILKLCSGVYVRHTRFDYFLSWICLKEWCSWESFFVEYIL